jgi:glutamate synthase (ferredoxin)
MMQIPHRLMVKAAREIGIDDLGAARSYGLGMFFLPQETLKRLQAKKMLEIIVARHGVEFLGWREVPVCPDVLGQTARQAQPCRISTYFSAERRLPVSHYDNTP